MTETIDILSIIENEITSAEYTAGESDDMNLAMDYYMGKPRGDEVPGRSSVQSLDVADMIEAITAQIMPLLNSDQLVMFEALNPDDEQQARIESMLVNYIVMEQNNGYVAIQEALRDALLFRNCIIKVYMKVDVRVRTEPYNDLSEIDLAVLNMEKAENEEIWIDEETGHIKRRITYHRPIIEAVPPEEFLYSNEWNKVSLAECPFTAHHRELKRYELIEMGYDPEMVAELPATKPIFPKADNLRGYDDFTQASSHATDPMDYYECYVRADDDGDGYAELRKVCKVGNTIIFNEEIDFHPFAGGTGLMMPHKFRGLSVYDRQKEVQDAKTFTLRQWMDNLNLMNNRKYEVDVDSIIDPNDLLDTRPASFVKSRRIGSVAPIPVDDSGVSSESALNYWDRMRTNRSGASLDMQSENMQLGEQRTAHGAERLVSSKEQIAALLSRTFAETCLKETFLLTHKTMRTFMSGQQMNRINQEWVSTDPMYWPERPQVVINIGDSEGIKNKRVMALNAIIDRQAQVGQAGLNNILVNPSNGYQALLDAARCAGIRNPEKYWMDPNSEEAQQTIQQQQQQAQEQTKMQADLAKAMTTNELLKTKVKEQSEQAKSQLESMKLMLDKAKSAAEVAQDDENLRFDYIKHYNDLAMQLTMFEAQYKEQITDYDQNRNETLQ